MKVLRFFTLLGFCFALILAVGSVGGYDDGTMNEAQLLACCGASMALMWASVKIYNKTQQEEDNDK
jgi:fucose permease